MIASELYKGICMSFQVYLDNIEEKTGKTPRDFIAMAEAKGFNDPKTKAGDILIHLGSMSQYYEVFISAETQEQADVILNTLLAKKLVTGGQFFSSPARFLWKQEMVDMNYITITSFTSADKKQALIALVEGISAEEVPMIRLVLIEANPKLERWIRETLA